MFDSGDQDLLNEVDTILSGPPVGTPAGETSYKGEPDLGAVPSTAAAVIIDETMDPGVNDVAVGMSEMVIGPGDGMGVGGEEVVEEEVVLEDLGSTNMDPDDDDDAALRAFRMKQRAEVEAKEVCCYLLFLDTCVSNQFIGQCICQLTCFAI